MSPRTTLAAQGDRTTGHSGLEPPRRVEDLPPTVIIEDAQAIRALAHEARLTALDELYGTHRTYTATELATLCGVTPSAMSYHLRALEKYGYIHRVEGQGDGRTRHWQAAARRLRLSGFESSAHAKNAYADAQLKSLQKRIGDEILRREAQPLGAEKLHPILSAGILSLEEDVAAQFKQRLYELVSEYEQASAAHGEPVPRGRVHYFISAIDTPVDLALPSDVDPRPGAGDGGDGGSSRH